MVTTRQSAEALVGWTLAEDGAAAWDSEVRWSYFVAERPGGRIGLCGLEPVRPTSASACLYLPGRFANSDDLLSADADDVRVQLARAGVPLYALDYRTHFVDPADEAARDRCSAWRTAAFLDDVAAAAAAVVALAKERALAVVAHSLGAKLAYLHAVRGPSSPDAVVVLDGWLRAPQPVDHGEMAELSSEIERWRAGAVRVYESARWKPETGSRFAVRALERETRAGRLSAFPDGDRDIPRLLRLLSSYDRYWPAGQVLELRAAALGVSADGLEPFDDDLSSFRGRLLNVVAGARGAAYVERSRFTASLCGRASRTELAIDDLAHLDVVASGRARDAVAIPVARWLSEAC
jgi:pimeloyl-ACP methyl ester carboxylesterase